MLTMTEAEIKEALENAVANRPSYAPVATIFPRRPLLDRVIVREIPIEEYYEQSKDVNLPLDNKHVTLRSDRGVVMAVGQTEFMGGVKVGDVVFFDEFSLNDPVFLNPADRNRHDLPKYWHMRVGDLKGVQVA